MQIKKVYFLFLLAFCLAISTFAQAAKVEQLLLVMPEVTDQAPSAEFYTIIHSAIDYLGKAHTPSRFYIISKDVLTGDYAKIVLHSYGLKNGQIKILPDIGSLKLIDLQDLKVFGGISLNDQIYLERQGISFRNQGLIRTPGEIAGTKSPMKGAHLAIIALGTGPLDETTPSLDMVKRVETAVKLLAENPQAICIFSGGKTSGSISEAKMMALIALSRGVLSERIYLEENSRSTVENARLTARLAKSLPVTRFILVSRPTHLKRAVSIFKTYPEFKDLQAKPTDITQEEIKENLNDYLRFDPSKRVEYILNKIMKEYNGN